MNEEAAAQEYVRALLEADTVLGGQVNGVWLRSVAGSAPFPAIKIDRQEGIDLMVVGLHRVWASMLFLVRGIVHWKGTGQPDWTDVRFIADRIDAVLHDHEGQNAEIQVHAFREEPWTDETIESGDLFLHAGGMYRVRATSLV